MVEQQVKRHFTQDEAITAIVNAAHDGELPLEDRVTLLASIAREQQDQIRQEQQTNAANAAVLAWLVAVLQAMRAAGDLRAPLPVAPPPLWTFRDGVPIDADGDLHNGSREPRERLPLIKGSRPS